MLSPNKTKTLAYSHVSATEHTLPSHILEESCGPNKGQLLFNQIPVDIKYHMYIIQLTNGLVSDNDESPFVIALLVCFHCLEKSWEGTETSIAQTGSRMWRLVRETSPLQAAPRRKNSVKKNLSKYSYI